MVSTTRKTHRTYIRDCAGEAVFCENRDGDGRSCWSDEAVVGDGDGDGDCDCDCDGDGAVAVAVAVAVAGRVESSRSFEYSRI
jgi:hypothetical protein